MPTRRRTSVPGLATLAVGVLALSSCTASPAESSVPDETTAADATVTIQHAQGETEVPVNPERVLTFDIATLDTLDALGIEVAGVPQANLPDYLSQYESEEYLNIGTLFEPDLEVVNAAEADLIIVAGRSAAAFDALAELAPTIDLTAGGADALESLELNGEILGTIFDREDEVAEAVADIRESAETVAAQAADAGTGLVLMTSGGEVSAYGAASRFGIIHDVLGVAPAADIPAENHGEAVSFEFVRDANPDWLFVIDRDDAIGGAAEGQAAAQVLDNELVNATTAAATGQVVYLDANAWYIVGNGLQTVRHMIDQIGEALA